MKKLLILFFIPLLFGCGLSNDAYVSITFSDSSSRAATAIEDLGSVTEIKLYISEVGKNYYLSEQEIVLENGGSSYITDGQVITTTTEETPVIDYDDSSIENVWVLESNTNSIFFYIQTGVERVFTVKVTYDTGEIFMGSSTRTITSSTSVISIDVIQTDASIAESTFDEVNDFLQNW